MDPDKIDVLAQWYRYEEIAMHFNNLIMQFRLQLLGGAGAIGTVASYLIGSKVEDDVHRHWLRFLVSSGFLLLLTAAAIIDLGYYDRLLRGAVKALVDFENLHPQIRMSITIQNVVGWGEYAVHVAYGLLLTNLVGFTIWSFVIYRRDKRKQDRARD